MSDNDNYFKDIEKTIRNYLAEKNTDYGIMLTGEWGAGKTYYVKNYLGYVEEESKFNKPLYISVAGKSNVEEVINDLFLLKILGNSSNNKLNIIKTIANNGGKALLETLKFFKFSFISSILPSIFNIGKNISKEKLSFENVLVILDDLERLSKKINIEDLLYSIYDSFISNNIKVLFICNENEIYKKSENYKNIKEKIIRYTVELYNVNTNNFINFINIIKSDLINDDDIDKYFISNNFFVNKLIPNICSIFVNMKCYNIRTFSKFIDMSKYFLENISLYIKDDDCQFEEGREELFLYILETFSFVIIEYDNGRLDKFVFKDKESFDNYIYSNDDIKYASIGNILKKDTNIENNFENNLDEVKYAEDFNNFLKMLMNLEFIVDINIIFYFYKYLECGILDFEQIYLIYKPYIYFDSEYKNAFNVVIKCNCEYDEFIKNFNLIFNKMQSKPEKFELKNYFEIYYLIFIRFKDIIDNDIKEKYLTICKSNLKKCLENEKFDDIVSIERMLKYDKLFGYEINKDDNFVVYLKELIKKFTSKDDNTILEVNKNIINNLLEHINNKDEDYFKYDVLNRDKKKYLIFTKVVLAKIPKTINAVYIFSCVIFNIYALYDYYNYYREYDNSINSIKDMINNLIPFIDSIQTEDKCFQYQITELRNKIEEYNKSNI